MTSSPQICKEVFEPKSLVPSAPEKRIHTADDLQFFKTTISYVRLQFLLALICNKVSNIEMPVSSELCSPSISGFLAILDRVEQLLDQTDPITGPRRFGNPAFKTWYTSIDEQSKSLITKMLDERGIDQAIAIELSAYLLGSLGSNQRLDFGTGHELSFLAFFGGCYFLGALTSDRDSFDGGLKGQDILWIFDRYFTIIRKSVRKFSLEPAGSHGVWGLDDHFHLPYIIGSAQLKGQEASYEQQINNTRPPARSSKPQQQRHPQRQKETLFNAVGMPLPSTIAHKEIVPDYKDKNMFYGAIQFINEVKRGPFFEHSPVLYDISGVATWSKVNSGLLKMYNAEVLGKFPVVQHFPFGSVLFPWEQQSPPSD
ncbi:Phosphotyrosyl phosphatase activator [Lipomyces oligophaga]|uniref:Phosphotyrosyl phosphatase activator n=1 Tax=Lipomyces oligophaga TaxID=45792 RepID=UPI0034CE7984